MDTTLYVGLYGLVAGLVFFFTSGPFGLISHTLETIFVSLGLVFIYIGIAFILWNLLNSFEVIFEKIVRRD